jgi:hypothetical protein
LAILFPQQWEFFIQVAFESIVVARQRRHYSGLNLVYIHTGGIIDASIPVHASTTGASGPALTLKFIGTSSYAGIPLIKFPGETSEYCPASSLLAGGLHGNGAIPSGAPGTAGNATLNGNVLKLANDKDGRDGVPENGIIV